MDSGIEYCILKTLIWILTSFIFILVYGNEEHKEAYRHGRDSVKFGCCTKVFSGSKNFETPFFSENIHFFKKIMYVTTFFFLIERINFVFKIPWIWSCGNYLKLWFSQVHVTKLLGPIEQNIGLDRTLFPSVPDFF